MSPARRYLDFIIYWAIVLLPFSFAIAPGMTYAFIILMALAFISKKIITRERLFIRTPIDLQLLLLIVAALISFKNSVDYRASIQGVVKLLQNFFLLMICAEEIKDKKHIQHIVFACACGVSLAAIDGLWQVIFGKDFIRGREVIVNIGIRRATAAFPNSNILGIYLSALAPLVIGTGLFFFKGLKKALLLVAGVLAILGIFLTFSRGTALAVYLSLLSLGLMRKSRIMSWALIGIILVCPFIMPQSIRNWAKEVNYNPLRFMLNDDRISAYKNAMNMIQHHPVVGVGVNTFSKNYLTYKLAEPDYAKTTDTMYAHNIYLHMAGETGLVGLGIFLWLLFVLFRDNFLTLGRLKDDYLKVAAISISACLIAFLINGLTETSLYYARIAMIFWFLVGISLSFRRLAEAK